MSSGERAEEYEALMGADVVVDVVQDEEQELRFGHSKALAERLEESTTVTRDEYYDLDAQWDGSAFGPDIPESDAHRTQGWDDTEPLLGDDYEL